jgi:hypothetical protein
MENKNILTDKRIERFTITKVEEWEVEHIELSTRGRKSKKDSVSGAL